MLYVELCLSSSMLVFVPSFAIFHTSSLGFGSRPVEVFQPQPSRV